MQLKVRKVWINRFYLSLYINPNTEEEESILFSRFIMKRKCIDKDMWEEVESRRLVRVTECPMKKW
jgi:hypothetical protein